MKILLIIFITLSSLYSNSMDEVMINECKKSLEENSNLITKNNYLKEKMFKLKKNLKDKEFKIKIYKKTYNELKEITKIKMNNDLKLFQSQNDMIKELLNKIKQYESKYGSLK